jgi:uncharacterized membrane protein YjjP (DUF1212 family)
MENELLNELTSRSQLNDELLLKAQVVCSLGCKMAQTGAETRLVVKSMNDMAMYLGLVNPQINYYRDSIQVYVNVGTVNASAFKTINVHGFNLYAVTELTHLCNYVKEGKITDPHKILRQITEVKLIHYNKWFVISMESLAAAGFAYTNHGTLKVMFAAFFGGFLLMNIRIFLTQKGFFESFIFMVSAFFGSTFAFLIAHFLLEASDTESSLSLMATSLLLVPGFPLVNGFLDLFKGYILNGVTRLATAFILIASATIGLVCAIHLCGF